MPPATPAHSSNKDHARRFSMWNNVECRALAKHVAVLPDPADVAFSLGERELIGLRTAWLGNQGWRCRADCQRDLAALGLCEVRGPFLTNYGVQVRTLVKRDDA